MSKLPRHQIATIIAKRSLQNVSSRKLAGQIAAYMTAEKRTAEVNSLVRDIMQYRADNGIVEVSAVSAHPLTDTIRRDIKARVKQLYPSAKQIIISEELDESVLGGIRLELANQQYDASLRRKLNRFKELTAVGKD